MTARWPLARVARRFTVGPAPLHTGRRHRAVASHHGQPDPQVVEATLREKARRALYAGCDRAPFGWEAR